MLDKLHEECGVFGIFSNNNHDISALTYYALFALQHRGQESCGIAVNDDGVISSYRDSGLVSDVFTDRVLEKLGHGQMAIGHVRYGTADGDARLNAQPLVVNHVKGCIALANNGSLTNAVELRRELELKGSIFHTTSDAELISYIITRERLTAKSIEEAVCRTMNSLEGAYSIVLMSPTKLIAARDPYGFHPLCIGKLDDSYVVASETCALDSIGATFVRDVEPGEVVVIDKRGITSITEHCNKKETAMCVFELIYFARPDSVVDGSSVHDARQKAGEFLAIEHPVEADVVIGVPDSGLDAAIGYSRQSGIPYGIGFIKNKYIGRTFIQPTQADREKKVRIKLNTVASTVKGKRVVLIDDSIVRGTTIARIVKLLRDAGAKEVHMRSSAPQFLYPCYYGTDIDSQDKLIAWNHTMDEMREIMDVDSLGFLSTENVTQIAECKKRGFCTACFTGEYPCTPPKEKAENKYSKKIGAVSCAKEEKN